MQRRTLTPRSNWLQRIGALGVDLEAAPNSPYWREDAAYVFTSDEIEMLETAGVELARLIHEAVAHVVAKGRFEELGIEAELAELAAASWTRGDPSLYGRFDLRFDGSAPPKLLEYNADTPTALFEAAVVQWHWLEECFPGADQYNAIHEALIARWNSWRQSGWAKRVHLACMPEDDDDLLTTAYLQDTALQAGLDVRLMDLTEVGWDGRCFRDLEGGRIETLFKLYPWDWLLDDEFFPHIAPAGLKVLEPAWRIIPASKGILPILWELFPGHPNLLPAAFDPAGIAGPRILKPLHGREGANMVVTGEGLDAVATGGPYEGMEIVAQAFQALPAFDGWRPVVGMWMVGDAPHGIGIREDLAVVTGRGARFVPHLIEDGE
ncbi:MAG: glutathionylspermidine synthase family protein [Hyphomicrobiaceae bacterium]